MANKKTSIGGQALIEGIMMRGPEKTAMAVRNASGTIITEEWETSSKVPKICKLPVIRGVYGMISSLVLGYKCMLRSADIAISDALDEGNPEQSCPTAPSDTPNETDSVPAPDGNGNPGESVIETTPETATDTSKDRANKDQAKKPAEKSSGAGNALMGIVTVISLVFAVILMVGLFIMLPTFIGGLIIKGEKDALTGPMWLARSAIEGVLRIVFLVLYMWIISFMKDIRRTFSYHGAEHKTIFCYEHGLPLTVENIRKEKRFHPRCGTSFLILMLIVGIVIGFFIRVDNLFLRAGIKILLLPITVGIGYELIKFAGRHDNILTKIISAPGVALQHITVLEPDDSMIECAIQAMSAVIPEDQTKDNW